MMIDASTVIQKRLLKISKGGVEAIDESHRMFFEKVIAAAEAGAILSSGGGMTEVVANYRRHLHDNNERLSSI